MKTPDPTPEFPVISEPRLRHPAIRRMVRLIGGASDRRFGQARLLAGMFGLAVAGGGSVDGATGDFLRQWTTADSNSLGGGDLVISSAGEIYVVAYPNSVEVYNRSASLLRSWTSSPRINGIGIHEGGSRVFLGSPSGGFKGFGLTGGLIFNTNFSTPWFLTSTAAGTVYVDNDTTVGIFNSAGVAQGTFGTFTNVSGMAFNNTTKKLYLVDRGNHRIRVFQANGALPLAAPTFVSQWGSLGTGNGQFTNPGAIAIDESRGVVYVTEDVNRVQAFDLAGNFLAKWGSGVAGGSPGQFNNPWGIAVDPLDGSVYVTNRLDRRVQVFKGYAVPEIAVGQPTGTDLVDGTASIAMGSVTLGASSAAKTFTITNTGAANLTLGSITKDGTNSGDFTVNTSGMLTTVAPAGTTTFTVTFSPGAAGTRSAAIHIASNDSDENPFDISLTGTGVAVPEIAVGQPTGTGLVDGSASIAMGSVAVGSSSAAQTFIITNTGSASLTVGAITKDGTNPTDFTVNTSGMLSTVAPAGTTTFAVTFSPGAAGTRSAAIHIASNDSDENPFDITLTGTGLNATPVASAATYTRAPGTSLKINIANLIAASTSDPDGDPRTLQSVGSSSHGAAISLSPPWVLYSPANNSNDSFSYTINDGQGHTATGTISVMVVTPSGATVGFSRNALGQAAMRFAGIPGYRYSIERSTNLSQWTVIQTLDAPANGVISFTDPTDPPPPTAFYRMSYTPAP